MRSMQISRKPRVTGESAVAACLGGLTLVLTMAADAPRRAAAAAEEAEPVAMDKTSTPITVDGVLDEPAWKQALPPLQSDQTRRLVPQGCGALSTLCAGGE